MHRLEQRYDGQIGFVYLDTDDPAVDRWKQQLGYRSMPYFLLLDGQGSIVKQWLGPVAEEVFTSAFEAALAGQPVP